MINLVMWLIFGGLVGLLASLPTREKSRQALFFNVAVGSVGALFGGLVFGGAPLGSVFNVGGLMISFLGAVFLLGVAGLFRRGTVR